MPQPSPKVGYHLGAELIDALRNRFPNSACTHLRTIPATQAEYAPWPHWIHPSVKEKLLHSGITAPYSHQAAAADSAYHGNHTVIATGTSSGKSLSYYLPILSTLATNPTASALYITPTKALGSDQLSNATVLIRGISELNSVHPAPYDGDTLVEARTAIRDTSRFIFTNPDMLHSAILSNHHKWGRLLRSLRFIVIDECHSYRGVFGAHVSLVLRRLLRIARTYGSNPTVILASATTATPAEHASRLIGAPVTAITTDTAPVGARTIALWEPGFLEGATGERGAPVRRPAPTEAAGMMATLVTEGARTLTFVRSRTQAELVALKTQEELNSHGRFDLSNRIASYRAGYLAEDRRALEQRLDDGTLLGVATTNALELGIDVGGLDAVITAGFPGTIASFWQQAGRAGRRGQSSIIVLIARDDPLDTYLIHHPEALLDQPVESAVINPANPYILAGHLYCAALEAPLTDTEISELQAEQVAASLAQQGVLRQRNNGWFATLPPGTTDPHALVSLRGSGNHVTIVDSHDGRILGTIDQSQANSQVHPGAVYLHQGESFVVDSIDLDSMIALVHPEIPEYYTHARSTTDIRIVREPEHVHNPAPGLWVSHLDVEVTNHVVGYMMKSFSGDVIATVPLELPPQTLVTKAVAYTIDPAVLDGLKIDDIPGTLHAAEHAAIGLLPLLATCDRWDIGGVSTPLHTDTGLPTVFVYDGHPGGAGFAECGFMRFGEWIAATYDAVRSCACDSGCPSCVQSPKCGNGNSPLDKTGAIKLLGALCMMLDAG